MKTELKSITPFLAEVMLRQNKVNRPLSQAHIAALAKELKEGRWKTNGDTIRISVDNSLLDGQHRLHAVIRTGVTIHTWVMSGLPSDVFDTIDVGKRRSAADTLGCRGEKNAARLAAALVLIDQYMTGRVEKSTQYSNTEVEALLVKYPDVRASIVPMMGKKRLLLPSVVDSCHYLFSKKDPALTAYFVEKILKGVGLEEGCPWYVLRERLVVNSLATTKLSKVFQMALCIMAWNKARSGKQITRLTLMISGGRLVEFPLVQ